MNQLTTILLVLTASTAFGKLFTFNNFQQILSSCPDDQWKGADLVWAMDASSSVGLARYQSGIDFMKAVTLNFKGHIGDGADQSRMAMYEFDETQYTMFELDTFKTADKIAQYIESLRDKDQNGSKNEFVDAIKFAQDKLFNKARAGAKKVLVFVADGWTDEDQADIKTAADAARAAGIEIWFIGYETDISGKTAMTVAGDEKRVTYTDVFYDVNKFTGCGEGSHHVSTQINCHSHGLATCECKYPYYGPNCGRSISCDNVPVVLNGVLTHPHMCHGHGNCTNTSDSSGHWNGIHCECDKCWTGEFCQDLIPNCVGSQRCILYDTDYTDSHKKDPTVIRYMCDLEHERCIPDNIDCAVNVHTSMVGTRPHCAPPNPRSACKCTYPTGWCIPLEVAPHIFQSVASKGYIEKFFLGSS